MVLEWWLWSDGSGVMALKWWIVSDGLSVMGYQWWIVSDGLSVMACQWWLANDGLPVTACQWQLVSDGLSVTACQWQLASDSICVICSSLSDWYGQPRRVDDMLSAESVTDLLRVWLKIRVTELTSLSFWQKVSEFLSELKVGVEKSSTITLSRIK